MPKISDQMRWRIINAVGFQIVWFACVVGRTDWLLIPILLIIIHLTLVDSRRQEAIILLVTAAVGLSIDSTLTLIGLYNFNANDFLLGVIPAWLVVLWVGLGSTLRHSFDYLFKRPIAFPLIFGLLAPVSYFGGERIGAVELAWSAPISYLTLSGAWFIAAFILQWSTTKLNHRLRTAGVED